MIYILKNTVENFTAIHLRFKFEICIGSCSTFNELSNKVCVPNKTEDLNLSAFNMITGINGLKTLTNIYHSNLDVNLIEQNVI